MARFVNTRPYGSGNFKMLLPLHFSSDVSQLYEDIGNNDGIQAITCLANQTMFKKCVTLWNFNMGVSGKAWNVEYPENV